jgi:hypothetical protein
MNSALRYWRFVVTGLLVCLLCNWYYTAESQEADSSAKTPAAGEVPASTYEAMTPEQFREIVAKPGDLIPLVPQLSDVPIWTNATVSLVMKYASGRTFREKMVQTTRTVDGKYIVYTINSKFYHQMISSILAFDEKASTLKVYGLYGDGHGGDTMTEGVVVYNFAKKTFTGTSSYGDGFKEITTGFYTSTNDFSRTVLYKNGAVFMTREVTATPVPPTI